MKSGLTYSNLMVRLLVVVVAIHACELFARFPCNHADNLIFSYWYCAFALGLFEMIRTLVHRNVNFVFWFIFALVLSMPFIEDKLNIMMPYETWVERGMPGWGTAGWTHGKTKLDRKTPQAVEQTFPMNGCLIDNDQVDKDESYYKNWLESEVQRISSGGIK